MKLCVLCLLLLFCGESLPKSIKDNVRDDRARILKLLKSSEGRNSGATNPYKKLKGNNYFYDKELEELISSILDNADIPDVSDVSDTVNNGHNEGNHFRNEWNGRNHGGNGWNGGNHDSKEWNGGNHDSKEWNGGSGRNGGDSRINENVWDDGNYDDNNNIENNKDNNNNAGSNVAKNGNAEANTTPGSASGFINSEACGQRQMFRSLLEELKKLLKLKTETIQTKIVNGKPTAIAEFPWVVYLQVPSSDGSSFMCGGSLITKNYVLTAAHCVSSIGNMEDFFVRVGAHNVESFTENYQDLPVDKVIVHPKYNSETVHNDIALIKLGEPAGVEMPQINTICLSTEEFPIGTKCIVAGWGNTEPGASKTSDVLMRADIRIEPDRRCPQANGLDDTQLCAGGYIKHNSISLADSCQGDSGGPLFCKRDGVYFQAGVVSYGEKCGDPSSVGVYTKVARYIDWINSVITSIK